MCPRYHVHFQMNNRWVSATSNSRTSLLSWLYPSFLSFTSARLVLTFRLIDCICCYTILPLEEKSHLAHGYSTAEKRGWADVVVISHCSTCLEVFAPKSCVDSSQLFIKNQSAEIRTLLLLTSYTPKCRPLSPWVLPLRPLISFPFGNPPFKSLNNPSFIYPLILESSQCSWELPISKLDGRCCLLKILPWGIPAVSHALYTCHRVRGSGSEQKHLSWFL